MSLDDLGRRQQRVFEGRLPVFLALVGAVFGLLVLRLYYLQVHRGEHFRLLAEENRISLVRLRAPRGMITDRYGNVLVTSRPSFSISLDLNNAGDLKGTLDHLATVLRLDRAELGERVRAVEPFRRFEPLRIRDDVTRPEVARLEADRFEHPGVLVEVEPRRSYPRGTLASHVLGYVGRISAAELKARSDLGYRIGDYIGKMGIEKELDAELKGRDGFQQMEVDSLGRGLKVLSSIEPVPGHDVTLTLDLGLQLAAEEALAGVAGAVVALDPRDGAILAAVSSPAIDPNAFSHGFSRGEWDAITRDPRHPLQNRFLQAQYPPGSVFKIVTAAAALERGAITPGTSFTCRGSLRFGNRDFRCWKAGGHGEISLHRALVESCDVYFYQVGLKVGIEAIAETARDFGLGAATGVGLGSEASGLIPSPAWKRRARGESWFPGETLLAAIGQGYDLVTPVQAALLAATVANGGRVHRPHLVRRVVDASGRTVREEATGSPRDAGVSAGTLGLLRDALWGVVNEQGGTAATARIAALDVAGKTGTAQVVRMPARGERSGEPAERFRDHAWFVCWAPKDDPQVALAIIVEHGGHGGAAGGPIARKILGDLWDVGWFSGVASPPGAPADGETER